MAIITVDKNSVVGKIRPLHCVNNGPVSAREDQVIGNFNEYKALEIPYARNHDASFFAAYGGPHTVDINAVFPDFDADVNDENSYDFCLTDEYIENTLKAGTETFYRLGSRIEHEKKKYGTLPPKDNKKWAEICEHIIRHYNEGWADGFHYNITYWEIWNEPDMSKDDGDYYGKKTWGGTKAGFFELFKITAKHLKSKFPNCKIGGPAVVSNYNDWVKEFVPYCQENEVPLDFFSWHRYGVSPEEILSGWDKIRELLDSCGYEKTESICNEWNYVINWNTRFIESIVTISDLKGAAFTASTILYAEQNTTVDMLMYYDARPCAFCGLFDLYTYAPRKPYYPFLMFSKLYKYGNKLKASSDDEQVYVSAAKNDDGKTAVMISCYSFENMTDKTIEVEGMTGKEKVMLLDEEHDMEEVEYEFKDGKIIIEAKPYSVIQISE